MLMIKKTFKSYLDQDAVHKLITTMVKESIPWCRVMKEHFNKELVMTKEGDENFETSTNRLIRDDTFVKGDVEVRDHSHVTGKYRGSAHRNCDVNISLNYKVSIVFNNLKSCDVHFIMQELVKLNFKVNVIPYASEKYMSLSSYNTLSLFLAYKILH